MREQKELAVKKRITAVDIRIAASIAVCALTSTLLNGLGIKYRFGGMELEIIQKMTACISCLLCAQETGPISKKAGINRLIVTAIGGVIGVAITWLDVQVGSSPWLMVPMLALGVLAALLIGRMAGVPAFNARIGGVTVILVACTLPGYARVWYAVFRFVSTLYSVLVVLLITWFSQKLISNRRTV